MTWAFAGQLLLRGWQWVRSWPALVRVALGLAVIAYALWTTHTTRVERAYDRGREAVLARARFDSTRIVAAERARRDAEQRTDQVRTVIKWRLASVDSAAIAAAALAQQLPPSIDTLPEVVQLKAAVFAVARATQALRDSIPQMLDAAVLAERAAQQLERAVVLSQLTEARLENVALTDSITVLETRPRWRTVGKVAAAALGVGIAIGKYVLHARSPQSSTPH